MCHAARPRIRVADGPVSALDVSIRARVRDRLADLQEGFDLAYLLISHELNVVCRIAHEIMLRCLGRPVE